ncbi:MAG: hypothetical protein K2P63_07755, partial [Lachnospiraceae bacterium]|nr:hypothetical protein [Lachnospiraceae bacterium]
MERKQKLVYALGGFVFGVLLSTVVWGGISRRPGAVPARSQEPAQEVLAAGKNAEAEESLTNAKNAESKGSLTNVKGAESEAVLTNVKNAESEEVLEPKDSPEQEGSSIAISALSSETWEGAAVYTGGDTVSYQGRQYRARWWTQG